MIAPVLRRVAAACLAVTAALLPASGATATSTTSARQSAPSLSALIDEGDRLTAARRYDEAAAIYDTSLAQARESVRDAEIARALISRADLRLRRRQVAEGLSDAREALEIFERLDARSGVARSRFVLGLLENSNGDRAAAAASITRAIEDYIAVTDLSGAARAGIRLADIIAGDADDQLRVFRQAADHARAAGNGDLEAVALHRAGDLLFGVERYEEAMEMLRAAAKAFESIAATGDLGTVHNSMGRIYRAHGRLDEALREQKLALSLHRRGTDPTMLLQSLNAVGVTYQSLGYLEEARDYLQQALALVPSTTNPRAGDFLEANIASLLADFGQYAASAEALERVIARGKDDYPAVRNQQLANAYRKLGRFDDSLKAANRSLDACGTSKVVCAAAYSSRADALAAIGNRVAARSDSRTALDLIEQTRAQLLPSDANRREFMSYAGDVYSRAIGLSIADGDARAGLEAAELARARAFLDLLKSRSLALPDSDAPAATLTLRGAQDGPRVQTSASAATAEELIATAARLSSTMVAYWVGDDETFVWVVDRSGRIESRRIQVTRARLIRLVRETQPFGTADADARGDAPIVLASGDAAWRQLYALLIAPIRPLLPTAPGALLTIVPHDVLSRVSFAALKSPRGRYLLEDYTLHYTPAGALLQFTAARRQPGARTGSALLVADPTMPRRSALDEALPRLPGTRVEARAIEGYLGRGHSTLLQDAAATEAQVRALSGDRAVLHFATHAVIREDKPFESELMLAASGIDSASDGRLTAAEIYELRLHADLIVLSACRSAAGGVAGDAIAAFTRAFLYAGTATLVASVWDVADEPTNRLVPAFYRAWLDGAEKAAALRSAQLHLLEDLRAGRVKVTTELGPVMLTEHPVFWAGFLLFGEPR